MTGGIGLTMTLVTLGGTVLGILVGCFADGSTDNGTACQTDEGTYLVTAPSAIDAADGRTNDRTKMGTGKGACCLITATATHYQECADG